MQMQMQCCERNSIKSIASCKLKEESPLILGTWSISSILSTTHSRIHCLILYLISIQQISKMKLAIFSSMLAGAAAFAPSTPSTSNTALSAGKADLEAIAAKCNPKLGFYDPLALADKDFWGKGNEATIGFLRQSEIKHGRIAMFAFVGYIVQSNFVLPWAQTLAGAAHPSADLR